MSISYFNRLYIKYPIHVESYFFKKGDLTINIINQDGRNIENVEIELNKQSFVQEVNSHERVQTVVFKQVEKDNLYSKPIFLSTTVDGKKYEIKDFLDYVVLNKPKSIFNLGLERYLYKQNVNKALGKTKKDIKYLAQNGDYYWHCTCGAINLSGFDECLKCGNEKSKLFSVKASYEKEAIQSDKEVKIDIYILVWILVIFLVNVFIQIFKGDFLFENNTKNYFFGILNRFIVPVSLFLTTLFGMLANRIYLKKTGAAFTALNLILLLYLNVISAFFFVLTAYNLLFLVSVDILFIIMLIYRHFNLKNKIYHHLTFFAIVVLMFSFSIQWVKYSKMDLQIDPEGIYLNITLDSEVYKVPEKINNLPVYKIIFDSEKDYSIKELYIGENVTNISLNSTAVLPKLEKIIVSENNKSYYVKNNFLYTQDDLLKLVPMMTFEIYLNDKIIPSYAVMNNYYLTKVVIGNEVEYIGPEAFANDYNLTELIFETNSTIKTIEKKAFINCSSLIEVDFPISLEKMGVGVLEGCNSLIELKAPFIGEKREDYTDNSKSTDLFPFFFGSRSYLENELVPETLRKVEIFDIGKIHNRTFYRSLNIEEIIFPSEMAGNIGVMCFFRCENLKSFIIPSGIGEILEGAFEKTLNMKSIVIPASVVRIEKNAFKDSGIESVIYLGDINNLEIISEGNETLISLLS